MNSLAYLFSNLLIIYKIPEKEKNTWITEFLNCLLLNQFQILMKHPQLNEFKTFVSSVSQVFKWTFLKHATRLLHVPFFFLPERSGGLTMKRHQISFDEIFNSLPKVEFGRSVLDTGFLFSHSNGRTRPKNTVLRTGSHTTSSSGLYTNTQVNVWDFDL